MKILIIKTSSLGDIIHAFPVISYLKSCYPAAQIDWVVEKPFSELLLAHPSIHKVLTVQTKLWRKNLWKSEVRKEISHFLKELRAVSYDLVLDLQGNVKSGIITAAAKSPKKVGFDLKSVPEWPNWLFTNLRFNLPPGQNIREDYLFLAQSALGDFRTCHESLKLHVKADQYTLIKEILNLPLFRERKKIMVCPGSQWSNKKLSLETLSQFLELVGKHLNGRFLFIWGTPDEKKEAEELQQKFSDDSRVVPKLSLPALQQLMQEQDLIIAMDSLPLHLAGTTQTPTYSIFGPSLANKYRPNGPFQHSFQGACPYGKTFEKRCPILRTCKTGSCMKDLTAQKLFDDFKVRGPGLHKSTGAGPA